MNFSQEFIAFACAQGVLRFGEFTTKAGRQSPYFFNAGLFNDGASLGRLCDYYALAIQNSGLHVDVIFGPAYKGIPLAAGTAIALARLGQNIPFAYNRKEAKDHGEGGTLVGAPLAGNVLIIDDVITAGTSNPSRRASTSGWCCLVKVSTTTRTSSPRMARSVSKDTSPISLPTSR